MFAVAWIGLSSASYSFSVTERDVTRTGTIRPGPQTKSTVGTCDCGIGRVVAAAAPPSAPPTAPPTAAETEPSSPPPAGAATGYCSISIAARRE